MNITGTARVDKRTKNLVKRLKPHEIAVIDHQDLDSVSAEALIGARVKAVINAAPSISGKYPNQGPLLLCEAGIPILDGVGAGIMERIREGDSIELFGNEVRKDGGVLATGEVLTTDLVRRKLVLARANLSHELDMFVENTLENAKREKDLLLGNLAIPPIKHELKGKHVLVVVRGADYKEDLSAIQSYIEEVRPVLIGVDGGADALREFGLSPDIIIGDMDSITDETLRCGAEIIVHAYPDGRAPGLRRVERLGLAAGVFPAPGTSEDIAFLLAYEKGAELLVAVGAHSNMIDFLEKGRRGMASTFLVRLKVGGILVDAKGVNKLYQGQPKARYVIQIMLAGLIPIVLFITLSEPMRQWSRLLLIRLKLLFGL